MATTSLSLGRHWEDFIRSEVESGRYGSASEVVREALRALEDHKRRLEALRGHLAEGANESARGEYVENFSMAKVVGDADQEA
jgi:antitoxin ParD1/3/4